MPDGPLTVLDDAVPSWRRRVIDLLEFRPRETIALGVLCLAIVAGAAFAYARSLPKPAPSSVASPLPAASVDASGSPVSGSGTIFVHIAGAVAKPGVYELAAGARVIDGLTAAGGATAQADVSSINLARPLTDGERVYIPRRGEVPAADPGAAAAAPSGTGGAGASSDKVNINTATASELEELPGIGEVIAQRIVDYRTQHGPFKTIRDLLKVEGIGEKKFESIQDHVTV